MAIDGWKALPVRGVATTSPQKYKGAYLNLPALGRQNGCPPPAATVFSSRGRRVPAICALLLLLAGDVESNPGPRPHYPCAVCDTNVGQNAIYCKECAKWCHRRCTRTGVLPSTSAHLMCPKCEHPRNVPPLMSANPPPPRPPNASPMRSKKDYPSKPNVRMQLKILQLNVNGLNARIQELRQLVNDHHVDVLMLQETKLSKDKPTPKINGYRCIREDRNDFGGGLAIYVSAEVPVADTISDLKSKCADSHTEIMSCKVGSSLNLVNLYLPPRTAGYDPDLTFLSDIENCIIGGDLNAHSPVWSSAPEDTRGSKIQEDLEQLFCLNNPQMHTRTPYIANHSRTSPDATFCSADLALHSEWTVLTDTSSDHNPIIVNVGFQYECVNTRKVFVNYKKADWEAFTKESENLIGEYTFNGNLIEADTKLRNAITKASKHNVPAGKVPNFNPNFTQEIKDLVEERNRLKAQTPLIPDLVSRVKELNKTIKGKLQEQKKENFNEYVASLNRKTKLKDYWTKVRAIFHSKDPEPNPPPKIDLDGKIPSEKEVATGLVKYYSEIR